MSETIPGHTTSVSSDWQTEWRRGGGALVIAGLLIAGTWISASQQTTVLPNGRLFHPSPWGSVIIGCGVCIIVGLYIILATVIDRLWMPGRRYTEVDHSSRYSLWFEGITLALSIEPGPPETISARPAVILKNGGSGGPISARIEKMDVKIEGISPIIGPPLSNVLRLLPGHTKTFRSNWILKVPEGNMNGEISLEVDYGPPNGYPVYKFSYKVKFGETQPITMAMIRNGDFKGTFIEWSDIIPETDEILEG